MVIGVERRLVPFGVADVLREERKAELLGDLLDALGAERELPVAGHGVGLEQRHAVDHVLALGLHRGVAVLPGVAAVEEHACGPPRSARIAFRPSRCGRGRRAGRSSSQAPRNPPRSAHRPARCRPGSCRDRATSRPVTCGTLPRASPTPRLIDGSRNSTGMSWAWMSVRWTSVTLPTGSKRSRSACVSRCCAKARGQPPGMSAAVGRRDLKKFAPGDHSGCSAFENNSAVIPGRGHKRVHARLRHALAREPGIQGCTR